MILSLSLGKYNAVLIELFFKLDWFYFVILGNIIELQSKPFRQEGTCDDPKGRLRKKRALMNRAGLIYGEDRG